MQNEIRRALRSAGHQEARGENVSGFRLWLSKTPGTVYVECTRDPDKFKFQSTHHWGNEQIGKYAEALTEQGFHVVRQPRAGVDRLKVERGNP